MGSYKFSLTSQEVVKLVKNASFVAIAAAVTYVGQNISNVDFGAASAFIVPVVSFMIAAVVKWAKDNTQE